MQAASALIQLALEIGLAMLEEVGFAIGQPPLNGRKMLCGLISVGLNADAVVICDTEHGMLP